MMGAFSETVAHGGAGRSAWGSSLDSAGVQKRLELGTGVPGHARNRKERRIGGISIGIYQKNLVHFRGDLLEVAGQVEFD
jgi:hypothetical protein